MVIKAIIFDLDGTLICTPPNYIEDVMTSAFGHFDVTPLPAECMQLWFAYNESKVLEKYEIDPAEFWRVFEGCNTIENRVQHSYPYDDVEPVLSRLHGRYQLAIMTGSAPHIRDAELSLLAKPYFSEIITCHPDYDAPSKPLPEGLFMLMRKLKVKPDETLYVGNGKEDVIVANAAGVTDIIVERREYPLKGVAPSYRIESLEELRRFVVF